MSHLQLAAQLGMPIVCEKPLVAQRKQLTPTLKFIEDSGAPFMVAHHVRHQRAVTDIAEIVRSGRLGSPVAASLQWCFRMDFEARNARWKLDPYLGGSNVMFDSGVHAVDLAIFLFGAPHRVSAIGHHVRSVNTLDSVVALLHYPAFSVTICASQSASHEQNDLRITFGTSVVRAKGLLGETATRAVAVIGESGAKRLTYGPANLYRAEMESFCRSLGGATGVGATVVDAAVTARILFAVEDALWTGGAVDL
jgi:predicted dehydrogenase